MYIHQHVIHICGFFAQFKNIFAFCLQVCFHLWFFCLFTMEIFRSQTFSQIGFKIFIRVLCFVWTFPTSFCEWRRTHVQYLLTNIEDFFWRKSSQTAHYGKQSIQFNRICVKWFWAHHTRGDTSFLECLFYFSSFYLLCVYFILINCYVLICFQFNFKGV